MKQRGMVLLWSMTILSVLLLTALLGRQSSIWQIKLSGLQQELQIIKQTGEQLLNSVEVQLQTKTIKACQRSQPIIQQSDLNTGKFCRRQLRGINFAYTIATWGEDPCASLINAAPGVKYMQITVWTTKPSSNIPLMLQSSIVVAARLKNACQQGFRIRSSAKQSWRSLKIRSN